MSERRIAVFLPNLAGGGAEKVALSLSQGMLERNISLDLVLAEAKGPYLDRVPTGARTIDLQSSIGRAVPPLVRYLQETKPFGVLSHLNDANLVAILARSLAGVETKLVVAERCHLSATLQHLNEIRQIDAERSNSHVKPTQSKLLGSQFSLSMMKSLYARADAIVGVSQGVSDDLESVLGFEPGTVKTIYNPVDRQLLVKAQEPLDHPWFQPGNPPVFLAVGRLTPQKDFSNLIRAFAIVRGQQSARLLILGEGEDRHKLEAEIVALGIQDDVLLPGFVSNPYAYMAKSTVLVLSSRFEGLPNVLIEAMACGCAVVSTNCPSGPEEILAAGKYGRLVPIQNPTALAAAMLQTLNDPIDRASSIKRGRYFSFERAVTEYLKLFED